jgi:hypothetical protein
MEFCEEFKEIFSYKELIEITKEATLVFTDDNDVIDYLLWLRDKGFAELRLDYKPVKIYNLTEGEPDFYTKEEFLEMLRNSNPNELQYIEVD